MVDQSEKLTVLLTPHPSEIDETDENSQFNVFNNMNFFILNDCNNINNNKKNKVIDLIDKELLDSVSCDSAITDAQIRAKNKIIRGVERKNGGFRYNY